MEHECGLASHSPTLREMPKVSSRMLARLSFASTILEPRSAVHLVAPRSEAHLRSLKSSCAESRTFRVPLRASRKYGIKTATAAQNRYCDRLGRLSFTTGMTMGIWRGMCCTSPSGHCAPVGACRQRGRQRRHGPAGPSCWRSLAAPPVVVHAAGHGPGPSQAAARRAPGPASPHRQKSFGLEPGARGFFDSESNLLGSRS